MLRVLFPLTFIWKYLGVSFSNLHL